MDQKKNYDAIWEILASVYPNLRNLHVALMAEGRPEPGNMTKEQFNLAWLEPLDRLVSLNLQDFKITAPEGYYFFFKTVDSHKLYRLVETTHIDFLTE